MTIEVKQDNSKKIYHAQCQFCDSLFDYQLIDLDGAYISCPICKMDMYHPIIKEQNWNR